MDPHQASQGLLCISGAWTSRPIRPSTPQISPMVLETNVSEPLLCRSACSSHRFQNVSLTCHSSPVPGSVCELLSNMRELPPRHIPAPAWRDKFLHQCAYHISPVSRQYCVLPSRRYLGLARFQQSRVVPSPDAPFAPCLHSPAAARRGHAEMEVCLPAWPPWHLPLDILDNLQIDWP